MANQGIFTGGVKIRSLNGYLIAVNGEVFATTNTGGTTDAFFYKAKTTITSGDPGSGHLIWNNATQISATQLNVSHLTDTPAEDIDLFLAAIVSGNKLVVQDREESLNYQSWTVSGAPTQVGSTYWTIPVTFLESSGTGTTGFSNSHKLLFAIISGGTGGGGITTNAVTFNNSGSGAASGTSFNGATAVTVSYNTFGAQQASASLSSLAALSYASGTPFVKMTAAGTFALDTNTYLTANQTITLTGNVTGSGTTSITTTIGTNVVTNAMLAQIATARIKGRVTAGTGNVEDLTGTQVTTLLDNFTSALKGLAPASGGGTTNFLRADGTWAAPAGGGGSPAGSNTQIQYNNSGAFGASANLTWDGTAITAPLYKRVAAIPVNTVSDAILLENTTAATSASNVGYSPAIHFKGTGWPTPGSSSVPIDMRMYLTSESFAQASGRFVLDYSSNGSAYKEALVVDASTSFNTTLLRLIAPGAGSVLETQGSAVLFTNITSGQHDIIFGDGTVAYFSFRTDASTTKMSIRNYSGNADLLTVFRTSGNVVIANTTDNGVDKLQVSGSAIASTLKVNTSGQTVSISSYYNGGTGKHIWIGGGGLSSNSSSAENTAIGVDAMLNNTSGYYNSALGANALKANTTGFLNVAFGPYALFTNTTGNRNMAIGQSALETSNSSDNVAIGAQTLIALTSGGRNVGIGSNALFYATTGSSNVAVGTEAGKFITGGGNNVTSGTSVYLGDDTRASANGNSNEIVIGHTAIGQGSNSVTLGNSSITQTLLRGAVTGGSFIKSGGTSSQVLYADGGVKQITSGTAAPSGGNDGDIYLQYV
jgi:hypothetical protein